MFQNLNLDKGVTIWLCLDGKRKPVSDFSVLRPKQSIYVPNQNTHM